MRKILFLIILLFLSGTVNAVDTENRASNVLKYGEWFVVEFTMPDTITYRVGAESKLPQQRENIFIDISPLEQCKPGKFTVNQFIGYKEVDFSGMLFLPIKYKISNQEIKESITKPVVSDGFLFTPIEAMNVSELLKNKDEGNLSFWIQPPPDSSTPINKTFFPINGFSKAYEKAIELCKENM
ncbi:hypothetical protein ABG299_001047 [Salmonella enterica subsp. enterica]